MQQLAAPCPCTRAIDRSSRAGYRSILVLTSLANTRAGQSECRYPPAPIRTPEWTSRLSGQRRILFTQPCGTPKPRNIVQKAVFSLMHFPASFICLWPSCHFDLGGLRHGCGLLVDETGSHKCNAGHKESSLTGLRAVLEGVTQQWSIHLSN